MINIAGFDPINELVGVLELTLPKKAAAARKAITIQ